MVSDSVHLPLVMYGSKNKPERLDRKLHCKKEKENSRLNTFHILL